MDADRTPSGAGGAARCAPVPARRRTPRRAGTAKKGDVPGPAVAAAERNPLAVGVAIWLGSELMFFAGLFASLASLAAGPGPWPPEGVHLEVARSAAFTAVLLASSVTVHIGARAAEQGERDRAVGWLAATVALGAVFLTNQLLEYRDLGFGIADHAYGTIFYLLTGFHGLHVFAGLVLLGLMARQLARASGRGVGPAPPPGRAAEHATVASWYWHFVDVVWVGVFASVYLLS
jgi:cytochrome c oxidase subunit 3